jgi:hypothetical protein
MSRRPLEDVKKSRERKGREDRKEESFRKRCFARFATFAFNVILSQALKACATAIT